jgi:hypothetical protein
MAKIDFFILFAGCRIQFFINNIAALQNEEIKGFIKKHNEKTLITSCKEDAFLRIKQSHSI